MTWPQTVILGGINIKLFVSGCIGVYEISYKNNPQIHATVGFDTINERGFGASNSTDVLITFQNCELHKTTCIATARFKIPVVL